MQIKLYKTYIQLVEEKYIGKYIIITHNRLDPYDRKICSISKRYDAVILINYTYRNKETRNTGNNFFILPELLINIDKGLMILCDADRYENTNSTLQDV